MKRKNLFKTIAIASSMSLLLTACALPPVHQAVTGPDDKDKTEEDTNVNDVKLPDSDISLKIPENDTQPDTGSSSRDDESSLSGEELWEKTVNDYISYFDGNSKAFVSYIKTDFLTFEQSYSYREMIDEIDENLPENWHEDTKVGEVNYAIIDCGKDDIPEMVINFDIYGSERNNRLMEYYVLKYLNGNLCVVDSFSSYENKYSEINGYGINNSWGSLGDHTDYDRYDRCNGEGIHEFVFSCTTESDLSEAYILASDLPSDVKLKNNYPSDYDYSGEIYCHAFSFEEYDYDNDGDPSLYDNYLRQIVYVFENDDEEIIYPDKKYMDIYKKAGITVTDWDGLNTKVDKRLDELNLTREELGLTDENTAYPFSSTANLIPFYRFLERFED
ncbi:MAG: hypothetical protein K5776_11940 [Lachnospiraceae bacterium]|nr:hypothetical protein [Lachnospiraceae bacterium]